MTLSNQDILDLVRALPIPTPWDRDVFVQRVAEKRGRPIALIPTDTASLTDSPCGLWMARDHDDLILHERGTSDYHIDQIVCHEIGHMILGHRSCGTQGENRYKVIESAWRQLLPAVPDFSPESVHAVLGRKDYGDEQEREAEMFASLLMIATEEQTHQRSIVRRVFLKRI